LANCRETPRVLIPDPELVKEVLSNKFNFGKLRSSHIGRLLANGLVNHDGEKWAKHRSILNPAFHHEKINVFLAHCSINAFLPFYIAFVVYVGYKFPK
jgi:cytochrome P450